MTKKQLRKKVRSLINMTAKEMRYNLELAMLSGAVDIKSAENNYVLPKTILIALLKEAQHSMDIPSSRRKQILKDADNIYACI